MRLSLSPDARSPRRRADLGGDGAAGAPGAGGTAGFGAAASVAAAHTRGPEAKARKFASNSGRKNGQRATYLSHASHKTKHKVIAPDQNEHRLQEMSTAFEK